MMLVTPKPQRKIFFEGNSLMANNPTAPSVGSQPVPMGVYNNAVSAGKILTYTSYALAGRYQQQINADRATNIYPYLQPNDIIVIWEGTNDFQHTSTPQEAYDNLELYVLDMVDRGAKLMVCTMIARNYVPTPDPPDIMDQVDAYNDLIRANLDIDGVTICDLGADSHFDDLADCNNTTYYLADKLHINTTGVSLVISLMNSAIAPML